jgi:hypothetical protein
VQVDDADIALLARSGASVSHNPASNLKLQNGIAPVGPMLAAGVNVCLGSDGQSSAGTQSLFTQLQLVAALAGLNGLRELPGVPEEAALAMASANGYRLWWRDDLSGDRIELAEPVGRYAYAWDDPVAEIAEVVVAGEPRLARARELVRSSGALETTRRLREEVASSDAEARAEAFARALDRG